MIILLFGLSSCGREHPANKRTVIPYPQTKADFQSVDISPTLIYINNNVTGILPEQEGNMWFSTHGGNLLPPTTMRTVMAPNPEWPQAGR